MDKVDALPRSPELMGREDTGLLVVDVQERLIDLILGHQCLVWNVGRLVRGAQLLQVAVSATEQYPRGLGSTVSELAHLLGPIPDKLTFSCGGCPELFEQWTERGIYKILVAGIESHICVQQTVLDLLANGFHVYLAVDAVGSRRQVDHDVALRRMDASGAILTSTEAALFEWCQVAGTDEFKQISGLVREEAPSSN